MKLLRPLLGATLAAIAFATSATDIARTPLTPQANAKPAVIFGMDNSGSMDYEVLLSGTIDGAFWWNPDAAVRSGWAAGVPLFGGGMPKYTYLFPNGCDPVAGRRTYCDGSGNGQWAIAPTAQFAALRSAAYNPLYYDPLQTYSPWVPGMIGGTLRSYVDSDPHAALADPAYPFTMALDAVIDSTDSNFTFHFMAGMVVPAGARIQDASGNWTPVAADFTVPVNTSYDAAVRYFPATYWVRAACTVNNVDCAAAPDGATLRRYEIRSGNSFPSGRSPADELKNFANWFTFARKRRWMLAGSMGRIMNSVSGLRVGVVDFNGAGPATMYDVDATGANVNGSVVTGHFQTSHGGGGTPTRQTLAYIGEQFRTNPGVVTSSCQRNAVVMVTDGFAELSPTTPPAYSPATYGAGAPYQTTYANSLADIALSYYTNNLRPDLAAGQVAPLQPSDANPAADRNPNPHLNTYGITLGAVGNLWPAFGNPYVGAPPAWPSPEEDHSPKAIDDLWHATINGRGLMLKATNPDDTAAALRTVLADIGRTSAAQSGVAFSTTTLAAGDAFAYAGSFQARTWSGDVAAYPVDTATGRFGGTAQWSANALLIAGDWRNRRIFSFDGNVGVAFTVAGVGALVNPQGANGVTANLVDYLRGDRSREGTTFRARSGVMGADIDAEPVVDRTQGVVYATTNEGMLHALDKATGQELWAYVPGFALADAGAESQPAWTPATVLDATPVLATAAGRRMLVGGRGSAGPGFYALDVGQPRGLGEGQLAAHVMWEFPNAASASPVSTADQVRASVGASMGKPVVVNSARWGSVVLVTSGYNTTRDGRGRLFVLDAATGTVRAEIATPAGSLGVGDAGLAQVAGFVEPGGTVRRVYGGDLLGNLWRFDIDDGSVQRVASLLSAQGTALPVTSSPELGTDAGRRMVYVGTGRLLGASDFADSSVNSVFALWDNDSVGGDLRPLLAPRTLILAGAVRHVSGTDVAWGPQRGWVLDLPAGEKVDTDPSLALGILTWTANQPSQSACQSASTLYAAAAGSGLELPPRSFPADAWFGAVLGPTLASRPTLARLADGSLVDATQQSDASTTQHRLLVPGASAPRKTGWREIRR